MFFFLCLILFIFFFSGLGVPRDGLLLMGERYGKVVLILKQVLVLIIVTI